MTKVSLHVGKNRLWFDTERDVFRQIYLLKTRNVFNWDIWRSGGQLSSNPTTTPCVRNDHDDDDDFIAALFLFQRF